MEKKIISFSTLRGAGGGGKKLEEDSAREAECAVVVFSASYVSLKTKCLVCDSFPLPGFLSGPVGVTGERVCALGLGHTSLLVPPGPRGAEQPLGRACVPSPGPAGGSLRTGPT